MYTFKNELGNEISFDIFWSPKLPDEPRYISVVIAGPNSISDQTYTESEARALMLALQGMFSPASRFHESG